MFKDKKLTFVGTSHFFLRYNIYIALEYMNKNIFIY